MLVFRIGRSCACASFYLHEADGHGICDMAGCVCGGQKTAFRKQSMSLSNRRIGIRYGLAIVSVAVVALLRWSLQPALADAAPLILFVLPIMAAGWYGGIGPALLATLLGTLTGAYLFLPAASVHQHLQWNDLPAALTFFAVAIAMSISHDIAYRMCRRLALRTAEAKRRQQAARRTQDRLSRFIDSTNDVELAQRELEEANRAK